MSHCYRMPSLDRADYMATILQGAQIHARAELRSSAPLLVVASDRLDIDDAVRCLEPRAQLVPT